jgi:thiamine-phosphate pyrophosphorylase
MKFGIYGIVTNPLLDYKIIAEAFAEEGVRFLQLREKHKSDKEIVAIARQLKEILNGSETLLVINDRPDIAKIVHADALHLGQNDLSYSDARLIVGEKLTIGLSTHNLQQLTESQKYNLAYVGFGPIFPTVTKEKPDPVVGTELLKEALKISMIPIVAIGGIFPENLDEVLNAGARNICMVRFFMEAKTKVELKEKIKFVKQKIDSYDTASTSH